MLLVQLALNGKVSNTIRVIPFFANFGKEPNLFKKSNDNKSAQSAI